LSLMRNEVNHRASAQAARGWSPGQAYYAEDPDNRAQRHTLALREVAYVVRADIAVQPGVGDDVAKYRDQFRRRVARGACAFAPYLGTRECMAHFGPRQPDERPLAMDADLGRMLLDIAYEPGGTGRGSPRFFDARLAAGVLHVPR